MVLTTYELPTNPDYIEPLEVETGTNDINYYFQMTGFIKSLDKSFVTYQRGIGHNFSSALDYAYMRLYDRLYNKNYLVPECVISETYILLDNDDLRKPMGFAFYPFDTELFNKLNNDRDKNIAERDKLISDGIIQLNT